MFKSQIRTLLSISLLLIGMYSHVFGMGRAESKLSALVPSLAAKADKGLMTISDVLDQAQNDVFDMKDVFGGKLVVKNLYSQALKIAK